MVTRELGTAITLVIVVLFTAVGFGSYYVTKQEDAVVEEFAEAIIEQQLGLEEGTIDLTPFTSEK